MAISLIIRLYLLGVHSFIRTPLKKVAEARDIANQIVLISSPTLSGHVSGQILMVDGGMEGRLLNVPSEF